MLEYEKTPLNNTIFKYHYLNKFKSNLVDYLVGITPKQLFKD